MGKPESRSSLLMFCIFEILIVMQSHQVSCNQHKVGDLDSWGLPTASKPQLYTKWAKSHIFKIGDTLLFLYPPSEDSVIQVTEESYKSCTIKDPILLMKNGNSLFNITKNGEFFFTSGKPGHCEKNQKLKIAVGSTSGSAAADPPSYGPGSLPDTAPSYPRDFGSVPLPGSSSSSRPHLSLVVSGFVGSVVGLFLGRIM